MKISYSTLSMFGFNFADYQIKQPYNFKGAGEFMAAPLQQSVYMYIP